MIARLRGVHRASLSALAVLLPALFVASLSARRAPATMERLPSELAPWPAMGSPAEASAAPRFRRIEGNQLELEVLLPPEWNEPDALLYWSSTDDPVSEGLPADAVLLGAVRAGGPRRFVLPAAPEARGIAILYSLARAERIASGKPALVGEEAR